MKSSQDGEHCAVPQCRRPVALAYYGNWPVCDYHWNRHCEGIVNLKSVFGIPTEEPMRVEPLGRSAMPTAPKSE